MIAELGFKQTGIKYDRSPRKTGNSKFQIRKLIGLGLNAIFNHSTIPLRLASYIGFFILLVCIVLAAYFILLKIFRPDIPEGIISLHVLVLAGIGLNALLWWIGVFSWLTSCFVMSRLP